MERMARDVFQFEGFALDATRRRLRAGDRDINLRPKSFDVLCCLVENAGHLVAKDDIIVTVWPNVIVSDDSLTQCVSDVRSALCDTDHRIIKTVPRRGYLFAAPVSRAAANESAVPVATLSVSPSAVESGSDHQPVHLAARRAGLKSLRAIAVALAALLLIATGAGTWFSRHPSGVSLPDRPSIAVLPFANMSGDPQNDYFSDGISEDLTTNLSKFGDLFVIAQGSAFTYKGKHVDVRQIGQELSVRYLLQGSVREGAERLRITAQLVDAGTAKQIWAETYDRERGEVFAIQDELTKNIVVTLVAHITRAEVDRVLRKPPERLAAYDYYLRGNAVLKSTHGGNHGEAIAAARALYEQAIAADPNYAPAFQAQAETYVSAWLEPSSYEPIAREYRQQSALLRALQLAEKAIELDGNLSEAHATRARILHKQNRRIEAMAEWERAFELNPNLADGRYGMALSDAGRASETIEYMKRIMRLDPFHPTVYFCYLGHSYYLTGRHAEALEALRRLPSFVPALVWRAAAAAEWGRHEEASSAATNVLRLDPNFTITKWLQTQRPPQEIVDRLADGLRKAGLPD